MKFSITVAENIVQFKEPVIIEYWPREEEEVEYVDWGDDGHIKIKKQWFIYYEYDFGMGSRIKFDDGSYWLDIGADLTDEQIVRRVVEFDLAHAFDHPPEDPNYTHTHWALYGNLKDRFDRILEENYE